MADTNIEWADAVWNPLAGCTRVSPGCQHCYAERMAKRLLATPAACRCISAEPLLGPVDIGPWLDPTGYACCGGNETCYGNGRCPVTNWPRGEDGELVTLDWVIAGGESGPNARPICREWLESMRDYCLEYHVPFFFKQWGEWTPGENVERITGTCESAFWFNEKWLFSKAYLAEEDGHIDDEPDAYRIGKRAAGRLLDGVEWSQLPEVLKKVNA